MRRLKTLSLISLFALSFAMHGKAPRMPELRGTAVLEMTQRAAVEKMQGHA